LVAIPTAIPEAPLSNNAGTLAGSTVGSFSESSKLNWKSTVSLLISTDVKTLILKSRQYDKK
jgi:hypothetical protein